MDVTSGEPVSGRRFTQEQRLLRPEDFKRVFAEGCRTGLTGLVVLSRPNDSIGPRLGIAIARKHLKRAVDRNRLRRQIRESFRLQQFQLGSRDYVVLARGGLERISPRNLRRELDRHWEVHIQRCARSSSP